MGEMVIPVLIFGVTAWAIVYAIKHGDIEPKVVVSRIKSLLCGKPAARSRSVITMVPTSGPLSSRVRLLSEHQGQEGFDIFSLEIRGVIRIPTGTEHAAIRVSISDVTEGPGVAAVQSRLKQWQAGDALDFVHQEDLGRITGTETMLSEWLCAAKIRCDWMRFARRGQRRLLFGLSIVSQQSGYSFAQSQCLFDYTNGDFGYIDLQENIQRAKTLAVALAFAVSAANNRLYLSQVEYIKSWARGNIDISTTSNHARRHLEKALNYTVCFFREGNGVDCAKICEEIVTITPVAERYDILEFCLNVAKAGGKASPGQMTLLQNLAMGLKVDMNRFRNMMDAILPVGMQEDSSIEVILGVAANMDKEETRQHLNNEYRKWNARVTSSDPEIQSQADQMLRFIAEARKEFVA